MGLLRFLLVSSPTLYSLYLPHTLSALTMNMVPAHLLQFCHDMTGRCQMSAYLGKSGFREYLSYFHLLAPKIFFVFFFFFKRRCSHEIRLHHPAASFDLEVNYMKKQRWARATQFACTGDTEVRMLCGSQQRQRGSGVGGILLSA